jgi:arylsulfatase A-like enzyme
VGKWHLGHLPQFLPTRHGFDRFLGVPFSNDMVLGCGGKEGAVSLPLFRDDSTAEPRVDPETLTERYTGEALRFLREHSPEGEKRGVPFFLYLAYSSPHTPLAPGQAQKGKSARGLYGDAVEELDASVGRVLQTLRDEGLEADTLVVFTSDNGPWLLQGENGGSAGLLREGKGSTWEGGVRVPCLAWWPGTVGPGRVSADLACATDWFATALALAGASLPGDRPVDGVSLVPLLDGTGPSPRQVVPYYVGEALTAVRKGPWKLHLSTVEPGSPNPLRWRPERHERPLLFHLEHDPSERFDVARDRLEVVADLLREVEILHRDVTPARVPPVVADSNRRIAR